MATPVDGASALVEEVIEVLDARAEAIKAGRLEDYLRGINTTDAGFTVSQKQYYANLQQLPLGRFGYTVPKSSTPSTEGDTTTLLVLVRLQLDGYDAVPVTTPARFSFVRNTEGMLVLSAAHDRAWERRHDVDLAPWDLYPIRAEEESGVLGIFDEASVDAADEILDAVRDGAGQVQATVPFDWNGHVVVYALSSVDVLASLDNLPGGDPDALDGVAFPVRAGADSTKVASTRFMIHPRMIRRDEPLRDRLVRHELTHVAMGPRDDNVPIWLSEGLAEFVSVQPVPAYERMISRDALEAAQAGMTELPRDDSFNGAESSQNYGIAWYACEYIAATFGQDTLWRVFDEMRRAGGTSEARQDDVLREVLGVDSSEVAEAAGKKIIATFG
ncbi:hypothetical protein [Nocardioides daedukensis]|uniref:hypothetical protein n=1 Tax=Nocardioides daedukensis TaxID=634462 RepID=UPI0015C7F54A|nr:hypothetical protein [Nocardioides daedukensis]